MPPANLPKAQTASTKPPAHCDAIKNNQSNPEELKALVEKLDKSMGNFKQVEEKLYSNVKE